MLSFSDMGSPLLMGFVLLNLYHLLGYCYYIYNIKVLVRKVNLMVNHMFNQL